MRSVRDLARQDRQRRVDRHRSEGRRAMTRRLATLAATLVVVLAGCASTGMKAPVRTKPMPNAADGFLAAVKLADITPALHLSLFGHGPEGRVATGVRLRL